MTASTLSLEAALVDDPSTQSDLLIHRARAGERTAFAGLYRVHYRRVYALCLRLTADAPTAEELTQEAFIRAWRKLDTFRGDAQFSTWLHRLTVNVVLQWQRRNKPWLKRLVPGMEEELQEMPMRETPGEARDLEQAILALPERARQVFVLVEVEGYTHEEAAEMMGTAVGTSKAQLSRARLLLRGMLS